MLDILFVYGTLRKAHDGSLHPLLRNSAEFIEPASIAGKLFHVAAYPGAWITGSHGDSVIQGEAYRLLHAELTLRQLDDYEECSPQFPEPHEYKRLQQCVTLASGLQLKAWLYAYKHSTYGLRQIENGDYFPFLARTHPPG